MDWVVVAQSLAAPLEGLSDGAGTTLRAAHAMPPDDVVPPCAVSVMRGFSDTTRAYGWASGTANFDVLVLLAPTGDLARRATALLRWITPVSAAISAHIQLGDYAHISGAIVGNVQVELAGQADDYAGLPYDMLRVPVGVQFREQEVMAP